VADTCDVVVVGLGAVGGATAHRLAVAGIDVIGVDRFAPPHEAGSSHGGTRITRLAVGEGDAYVELVARSHELWREAEAATGASLLVPCGGLVLGAPGDGGQHGVGDFTAATIGVATRHGIDHEVLGAEEVRTRFPTFAVTDDVVAYFEPSAGYLRVEDCVATQLRLAERAGASLRRDEEVLAWSPRGAGVRVETARGTIDAGRVVLAAGAWTPTLVPELAPLLTVEREVQYWFEATAAHEALARLPIFIWFHDPAPGSLVYGFPAVDGVGGGVKVATETYGSPTDPTTVERRVSPDEVATFHRSHVAGRLPLLSSRCRRAVVCLYTVTPDFGFVVDVVPECDRAIVVSACSGHGFKHAPAIGEAVAHEIAAGVRPRSLAPFSLDRFATTGASDRP
jgi:sarcosine oxidase